MKTLVVLLALAAIAIAAPVLIENRYVQYIPVAYQITPTFRREKKSATGTNNNVTQLSEARQFPRREINHLTEASRRNFGLEKPTIIVKNKLGYHLYRNSDEEQAQANSQQKCTKEVKVKLCDAENPEVIFTDVGNNSTFVTDLHQSKSDVEQSIKMAKQAVEKLQHMKHDWKHSNTGSDVEVHKDIEVARQALENIQQNFGNLETMNMQASTFSTAEAMQDAHLHAEIKERIAQCIEPKYNAEIARNLEDDFTAANNQDNMIEQLKSNSKLLIYHNHERTIKNSSNNEQLNFNKLEAKTEQEAIHQDTKAVVSEMKEANFDHENILIAPDTSFTAKNDLLDKHINIEKHGDAESSELDLNLKYTTVIEHKAPLKPKEPRAMKSADVIKMKVDETQQSDNTKEALESETDTLQKPNMNTATLRNDFVHHDDINSQSKGVEIESKSSWMDSKDNDLLAKASEHIPIAVDHKNIEMKSEYTHDKVDHVNALMSMKSVEYPRNHQKEFTEEGEKHSHMNMKSSDLTKMLGRHDYNDVMKSIDQIHNSEQVSLKERIPTSARRNHFDTDLTVKMTEHVNSEHHRHLHEATVFPAQAKNWQDHQIIRATVGPNVHDSHNTDTQRVVTFSLPMSHHNMMPTHHHYNQPHLSSAYHQFHHPSHDFQHNFHGKKMCFYVQKAAEHAMAHERGAETDDAAQRTLQMSSNILSGKSDLEQNTHWKQEPTVAAGRAYGSYGLAAAGLGTIGASAASVSGGSSGGSGVIGVFPHVNTGGSGIPLLLSCSPSVITVSHAKKISLSTEPILTEQEKT